VLKPIRDPQALRNATPEEFAERAAKVLSELNYVHPFREENDMLRKRLFPSWAAITAESSTIP